MPKHIFVFHKVQSTVLFLNFNSLFQWGSSEICEESSSKGQRRAAETRAGFVPMPPLNPSINLKKKRKEIHPLVLRLSDFISSYWATKVHLSAQLSASHSPGDWSDADQDQRHTFLEPHVWQTILQVIHHSHSCLSEPSFGATLELKVPCSEKFQRAHSVLSGKSKVGL